MNLEIKPGSMDKHRAAKLRATADLAGKEGNYVLARRLNELANAADPWRRSEVVRLPDAPTVEAAYAALGFEFQPEHNGHTPVGVYRRLAAAINSITSRGFVRGEIKFEAPSKRGIRRFVWESDGGVWSPRHWKVTGTATPTATGVKVAGVCVMVKSSAAAESGRVEWTAFTGRALDRAIQYRLEDVLAVLEVRRHERGEATAWARDGLSESEVEVFHDLHPSPSSAWLTEEGRIVLYDDNAGRAHLDGLRPGPVKSSLVRESLASFAAEEPDGAVPLSTR